MRKNHVFRPQVSEILEPRAVPSMAGVPVATGIQGIFVILPKQVSPTNPQVQAAFTAFDQSYIRAVDTLLSSTGPNGLVVPSSSSRMAFVSAIEESLQTFAEQLVLSLGTGSTTTTTTTGSTTTTTTTTTGSTTSAAASQVVSAVVGGGSNSLQSQLLGLSIAQIASQVPNASAGSGASNQALVPNVVNTAEQVRPTTVIPVTEAVGTASSTTDAGSTTNPSSPSTKAADDVRSLFGTFLNDYFKAVQGTLLATGSNGQVSPQANRAAFDAKVNQALQSLQSSLSASLARYPATSGLGPQIQSAIEGNGASSLKGQLASLATPQAAQAAVVRNFTLGSTQAIAQALAAITGDVAKVMAPAGP